ncbi:MAG: type II toxin-antitoxin system HicB family antitoxin [Caulobacteraceae bacterium]|nr:type II toxin-antitoxin system HicB family antitoxin [Caulobacteraceae bacterium]
MTLAYRLDLTPDDNDTLLVTCPALPELTTWGTDAPDAEAHAKDAAMTVLAAYMAEGLPIPPGDADPSAPAARLSLLVDLKARLYEACRQAGVSRAELARRLGWHREQVDRLFRFDHASRLDQLEAAFAALGKTVEVSVAA